MNEESKKLKELVEASSKILVTSHISPDPDAVSSLLLLGTTLEYNFPDKKIVMNSEELTEDLNFLEGYDKIQSQSLFKAIKEAEPELMIMVDAMNFKRCTREETEPINALVKDKQIKLAIIDHHERENVEHYNAYINQGSPAATQDVYETLFKALGLKKPTGYAQTTLLGIVSDTNRFMYDNPRHKETFSVVSDLLDAGASIEQLENKRRRFTKNDALVLGELASNTIVREGYTYSYISDNFKKEWVGSGKTPDELKLGCQVFINDYIRNIGDNRWGFVIYPDLLGGTDIYSTSFRSVSDGKDVSKIAKTLGGGGHKASAGAKFQADSVEQAIEKVEKAIMEP